MSELKAIINAYNRLSFSDRIIFYSTISNDIPVNDGNLQSFLTEVRMENGDRCVYCEGTHVVKNGVRKDGVQRYLCRDCRHSFIPSTQSVTSRTRKHLSVWMHYVQCMLDHKTLRETADECEMSVSTAFSWRHKILDAVSELAENVYLTGTVEADETFLSVSYKGNHSRSRTFSMPRKAHKRGNDNHISGLSSEKVCIPCAVNDTGVAYAKPAKLGKVSSACIIRTFHSVIATNATLCTDHEKAYLSFANANNIHLIQTDTDHRIIRIEDKTYGIQRVNAYHSTLKGFLRRFHGVSTKHLGNYIVWNNLMMCSHRKQEELKEQLIGQLLKVRMTLYCREISGRPPLPTAV